MTLRSLHRLERRVLNARVWAGIHFRTADREGARLGATVARYEHRHYFQPARGCHHAVSRANAHPSRDNPRT
jgi:hypothetical protein